MLFQNFSPKIQLQFTVKRLLQATDLFQLTTMTTFFIQGTIGSASLPNLHSMKSQVVILKTSFMQVLPTVANQYFFGPT